MKIILFSILLLLSPSLAIECYNGEKWVNIPQKFIKKHIKKEFNSVDDLIIHERDKHSTILINKKIELCSNIYTLYLNSKKPSRKQIVTKTTPAPTPEPTYAPVQPSKHKTNYIPLYLLIALFFVSTLIIVVKLLLKQENPLQREHFVHNPLHKSKTPTYEDLLRTPQWRDFRDKVLKIKGATCEWCGKNYNLQIHHKKYYKNLNGSLYLPWNYSITDLMVLCNSCHMKYHKKYKVHIYTKG